MQGLWVDFHKARGLFGEILDCGLICKKLSVFFIKIYGLQVDFCNLEELRDFSVKFRLHVIL